MKKILLFVLLITELACYSQSIKQFNCTIDDNHPYMVARYTGAGYTPAVTQNVYTKITPTFTIGDSSLFTMVGDTFHIRKNAGDLNIYIWSRLAGASGDSYIIDVFKNGVSIGMGVDEVDFTTFFTKGKLDYYWYVHGALVTDWFSFRITNISNSNDPTISNLKVKFDRQSENH